MNPAPWWIPVSHGAVRSRSLDCDCVVAAVNASPRFACARVGSMGYACGSFLLIGRAVTCRDGKCPCRSSAAWTFAPLCRFARPQRLIRNTGAVTSLSAVAHSFLAFGITPGGRRRSRVSKTATFCRRAREPHLHENKYRSQSQALSRRHGVQFRSGSSRLNICCADQEGGVASNCFQTHAGNDPVRISRRIGRSASFRAQGERHNARRAIVLKPLESVPVWQVRAQSSGAFSANLLDAGGAFAPFIIQAAVIRLSHKELAV